MTGGTDAGRGWRDALAAALSIGPAAGFLALALTETADGLADPLSSTPLFLAYSLAAALLAAATAAVTRLREALLRLAWPVAIGYFAFLKAAGWDWAPLACIAAISVAVVSSWRRPTSAAEGLLLLHAMGSLSALYFCWSIDRYLDGLPRLLSMAGATP
ncbi:MAG: hypothetical protein FJ197_06040 [Gammaproteobacteria bacterium]|nr:hypothetical protein [Gammaproteobacteria bacterium]